MHFYTSFANGCQMIMLQCLVVDFSDNFIKLQNDDNIKAKIQISRII